MVEAKRYRAGARRKLYYRVHYESLQSRRWTHAPWGWYPTPVLAVKAYITNVKAQIRIYQGVIRKMERLLLRLTAAGSKRKGLKRAKS